jgi:ABC-2 type transport system permease protein
MIAKFISLARAMLLAFLRDKAAVFFTILFPLFFLVLFGGLFKNQGAPKVSVLEIGKVSIVDTARSQGGAELNKILKVKQAGDRSDALDKVRKGKDDAAVEQRGDTLVVHYSAADQVKAGTVRQIFDSMVQHANSGDRPATYSLQSQQVEDKSLKTIQYLTPGLLGWALGVGAVFGAALTLVTWRQKRILRRLRLAPIGTGTIVGARVGVALTVGLLQMAIFIAVASLPFFGLKLSKYWWMSIPLVIAGTLAFLSIGLLVGAYARTQEAASGLANVIILPMAFLSGSFFPLDGAPGWLQGLAKVFPLRHLNTAMLDVLVRGKGPVSVLPELGILLGFAVVLSAISTRLFKWDEI